MSIQTAIADSMTPAQSVTSAERDAYYHEALICDVKMHTQRERQLLLWLVISITAHLFTVGALLFGAAR